MITPMKWKIDRCSSEYLNTARFYSDPALWLFMLTGGRGIGKTTNLVADAINDFMKNGNEFVYVRRYKTELDKCKELLQPIVTDTKVKSIGKGIFQYECSKVRIGYACALSMQSSFKSGIDFSKVNTVIFDEALLLPGSVRYLPNEVTCFLELLSTIFRTRKGYRVFIIGNNTDMFNPYHAYFEIPRFEGRYIDRKRGICCEDLKHKQALLEKEQETPLYRLTADTEYGAYHYGNEVLTEVKGNVGIKPKGSELLFRIRYNDLTLNVYRYAILGAYVELREKPIVDNITYSLMVDGNPNYVDIQSYRQGDERFFIRNCFYNGEVIYNDRKGVVLLSQIMADRY